MEKYYYDLHIHSCLSPCGSDDNTPNNIAGMGLLCGLQIMALTDHNTCKNCPAFFEAAQRYGITPVAGMELTTAEDIHVVCLFENLSDAMAFDEEIDKRRIKIKNKTEIFGNQFITDGEDNIIGEDENLLSNATTVSLEEVPGLVESFGGIAYPAHIDRPANGVIEILGTFPETPTFGIVEINQREKVDELVQKYNLSDKKVVISSDAHYLENIRDKENYFEFASGLESPEAIRKSLFNYLR